MEPTTACFFGCARTVSEPHVVDPLGLLFERKQIPQIVVNVRIQRKTMEPLEATKLPWAQLGRHQMAGWVSPQTLK